MQLRPFAFFSLVVALAVTPACSALVAPDTSRLGGSDGAVSGHDGGGGGVDAGMGHDGGGGDGGGGGCATGCDDGIPCTTDACDTARSTCTHTPDDAVCGAGMRCAVQAGCVAMQCASDAECSDGNACNGMERCQPGSGGSDPRTGCRSSDPLDCADGSDCTQDSCDPATGCVHAPIPDFCDDGFACTADSCGADGCVHETNDAACSGGCLVGARCDVNAGCVGGAPMSCPADGNPCTTDPTTCDPGTGTCLHPPRDDDGDGFAIETAVNQAGMTVTCEGGTDCDDTDPDVSPNGIEVCNAIDDDCNGLVDDGDVCGMTGPDGCSTATALTPGVPTVASTAGLRDDFATSCGGRGSPDAVYYVDIPGGVLTGAVDVILTTDAPETTYDTVLGTYLATGVTGRCPTTQFGFNNRCNDDITPANTNSRVTVCVNGSIVTAGARLFVLVDGAANESGAYSVTAQIMPRSTPCN
ncbi:MAG: putative metal-binding motif-containing protein [Sandaracinus sp.]